MKTRIGWSALGAIAALTVAGSLLSACGGNADASKTVTLSTKDNGRTVRVHPGDEIAVTLDSNVSTGFRWVLTRAPDAQIVELVGSDYVTPESTLLGAGGQEVWRFRASGEGTSVLQLTYQRSSGETAGGPFQITVDVAS
jgi:inhibitor of cysteine peptidase